VVDTMSAFLQTPGQEPRQEPIAGTTTTASPPMQRLLQGIAAANLAVYRRAFKNQAFRGMGSTVSAVWITPSAIIAANVGDSPIYLIASDRIELLSVSHNLAAEQGAHHSPEARSDSPLRHMLTRAVGIEAIVQPDCREVPYRAGDVIVLASDGFSEKVDVPEIRALAAGNPPQEACRRMIELANARGGEDNVTAIVVALGP
jgi:protein phosphatase